MNLSCALHLLLIVSLAGLAVAAEAGGTDAAAQPEQHEQSRHEQSQYEQTIGKRADGVVAAAKLDDAAHAARVREILLAHYRGLRDLQATRDAAVQTARASGDDAGAKKAQERTQAEVDRFHEQFISKLAAELTPEQLETVKNEMTYNVLPTTFKVYCEIHPNLTELQKATILQMLSEAREKAVSGFSAKEKHAWFGKYKGRINNYLSAEGYDLKGAEKAWRERRKAAAATQSS